ncbi:hypothetical protein ACLOJK_014767, partial [Asimina triloba]
MPDIQVWIPAGSGDYGYEGRYTPMIVEWETSIEPKCSTIYFLLVFEKGMKWSDIAILSWRLSHGAGRIQDLGVGCSWEELGVPRGLL